MIPELGEALADELCSDSLGDAEIVIRTRIVGRFGEAMPAAAGGLDCVLQSHSAEDATLWSTLDAYGRMNTAPSEHWQVLPRTAFEGASGGLRDGHLRRGGAGPRVMGIGGGGGRTEMRATA